jgi:hypothetical protein
MQSPAQIPFLPRIAPAARGLLTSVRTAARMSSSPCVVEHIPAPPPGKCGILSTPLPHAVGAQSNVGPVLIEEQIDLTPAAARAMPADNRRRSCPNNEWDDITL